MEVRLWAWVSLIWVCATSGAWADDFADCNGSNGSARVIPAVRGSSVQVAALLKHSPAFTVSAATPTSAMATSIARSATLTRRFA